VLTNTQPPNAQFASRRVPASVAGTGPQQQVADGEWNSGDTRVRASTCNWRVRNAGSWSDQSDGQPEEVLPRNITLMLAGIRQPRGRPAARTSRRWRRNSEVELRPAASDMARPWAAATEARFAVELGERRAAASNQPQHEPRRTWTVRPCSGSRCSPSSLRTVHCRRPRSEKYPVPGRTGSPGHESEERGGSASARVGREARTTMSP
jgi:hypothetical protein